MRPRIDQHHFLRVRGLSAVSSVLSTFWHAFRCRWVTRLFVLYCLLRVARESAVAGAKAALTRSHSGPCLCTRLASKQGTALAPQRSRMRPRRAQTATTT